MKLRALMLGLAVALSPLAAAAQIPAPATVAAATTDDRTGFAIITNGGYVSIEVDSNWMVLDMQSQMPVAAAVFQIPDPADEGTPHSTNLLILMCDPAAPQTEMAMSTFGKPAGDAPVTASTYKDWKVFTQTGTDGDTSYTLMDATTKVADVLVAVRLAYPHLKGQPADHDAAMTALFYQQLDSIGGGMGPYKMPEGATAWRPTE